jgi:hypothetical protein
VAAQYILKIYKCYVIKIISQNGRDEIKILSGYDIINYQVVKKTEKDER